MPSSLAGGTQTRVLGGLPALGVPFGAHIALNDISKAIKPERGCFTL